MPKSQSTSASRTSRASRIAGRPRASTPSSSSSRPIPARSCARWRGSRPAASSRASCSRCARWPRPRPPAARSSSTKSTPASAARRPTPSARGCRRSARRYQVLCVTHLPQIAARADAHFQITKHVRGGRTTTALARLDDAGREEEIARMIAGAAVSPKVLASAREMLATRRRTAPRSEAKAKGESESASESERAARGA